MLKKLTDFSLVFSIITLLCINTCSYTLAASTYQDIQNHWAKNEITSMCVSGHISGYPDGLFHPDNYITRAEFLSTLLSCIQLKPAAKFRYYTADNSHWPQVCVDEAINHGIIIPTEYPAGFNPDKNITRGETAAMIVRALGLQPDYAIMMFTDWNDLKSNPYQGYIKVAYDKGLISGFSNGEFRPDDPVTRAQACKILYRFLPEVHNNSSYSRNNSSYYTPYTRVTGDKITAVTLGNHKYSPEYVELYIDSRKTGYYVADAVVINEYTLKIGGKKYDLEDNKISVLLQNDYYEVQKIVSRNNKNDLQLQKTSDYWDNITMSDIEAIYTGSKKIDLDDINKVRFSINDRKYDLSEVSISISGYVKVKGTKYSFSRVNLIAGGREYDLDDVRVRSGRLVFYCDSSSGSSSERIKINNRYYNAEDIELVIDGSNYDIDDVVVVRRNVIRADGHEYKLDSAIKCRYDSQSFRIDSIDYDENNDRMIIESSDFDDEDISYIYPDEFLFYEDDSRQSSWRISEIEILVDGYWRDWDDIEIIDENNFAYADISYDFLGKEICRKNREYEITDTDWNKNTEELRIYLDEDIDSYIKPDEFIFTEDGYTYPWEIDQLELYIDGRWCDFEDIKVVDEDYYEYKSKTYKFRNSHLRRYYYEFEITGTYWDNYSDELEIAVEEI